MGGGERKKSHQRGLCVVVVVVVVVGGGWSPCRGDEEIKQEEGRDCEDSAG